MRVFFILVFFGRHFLEISIHLHFEYASTSGLFIELPVLNRTEIKKNVAQPSIDKCSFSEFPFTRSEFKIGAMKLFYLSTKLP